MSTLGHLKRGYRYYLGTGDPRLLGQRLTHCWHLSDLDVNLRQLLLDLDVPAEQIDKALRAEHVAPQRPPPLSETGVANLRTYWRGEYRVYDALAKMADEQMAARAGKRLRQAP